jgi:hypothetical protein
MDREAAVIRSEMTQTRQELDRKIARLEVRARELTPRAYAERHMPDYFMERVIGGVLTLIGLRMAWGMYKRRRNRREQVRQAAAAYGRW